MTADVVWIVIGVNFLIAAINIGNQWIIAFYNKRRQERIEKKDESTEKEKPKKRFWNARTAVIVQLLVGLYTVGRPIMDPHESVTVQALTISVGVATIFLAVAIDLSRRLSDIVSRILELIDQMAKVYGESNRRKNELFLKQADLNEKMVEGFKILADSIADMNLSIVKRRKLQTILEQLGRIEKEAKKE